MRKPASIILGVAILGLLVTLVWYLCWRGIDAGPLSTTANSSVIPVTGSGKVAKPSPLVQVVAPVIRPVPAGADIATGDEAKIAALHNAMADMADLLRKGDFATFAKNYAPAGGEKNYLDDLKKIQTEGADGQVRLRVLANVFETLASQTPEINPANNQVTFMDRTIYGISPPVALDKLPPGTDLDSLIRIRVVFVEENGHWVMHGSSFGTLWGALHMVSYNKMVTSPANHP